MAKNFLQIIKALEKEIQNEGVTMNRSKILSLYRDWKSAEIPHAELGLARMDFLRIKNVL